MVAAPQLSLDSFGIDQRVRMHRVSWEAYEALVAWRGDSSRPRMTYLEGELELMSPASEHETMKKLLARLLEAWAEEMDIAMDGVGSWTIRDEAVERGLEPDECYVFGDARKARVPDFAIEVVWTRGGLDKLEVYRKLGVREVWIWEAGALRFHLLRGERYTQSPRSELLPGLDPAMIARFMSASDGQSAAVKALRAELRQNAR